MDSNKKSNPSELHWLKNSNADELGVLNKGDLGVLDLRGDFRAEMCRF